MNTNQIERISNETDTDMSSALVPVQAINPNDCNYKKCNITRPTNLIGSNKVLRKDNIVFQTPQHGRLRRYYDRVNNKDNKTSSTNDTPEADHTILPPPLFDETSAVIISDTVVSTASLSKTQYLKSRRHHRTIPRHFTLSEPTVLATIAMDQTPNKAKHTNDQIQSNCSMNNNNNKKPICQCPIQHVPMTYMGSSHLNSTRNQPNDMYLSTLSRKQSHHKTHVAKSASFTTVSTAPMTSPSTTTNYSRDSASGLLSISTNASTSNSPILSISSHSQNNTLRRQRTPVKIPTISKQIVNSEDDNIIPSQKQVSNSYEHPVQMQIASVGKTTVLSTDKSKATVNIMNNTEITNTPFPIQLIESMGKSKSKEHGKNPILPPKTYKMSVAPAPAPQTVNIQSIPRIQTISKPTSDIGMMLPASQNSLPQAQSILQNDSIHRQNPLQMHSSHRSHHSNTRNEHAKVVHSKSLPRNDDRNNLSTIASDTGLSSSSSKNQSFGKNNLASTSFPVLTNHYTLPKASSAKMSLNNTINDVVNKVPSIINIPTPIADQKLTAIKVKSPTTAINKSIANTQKNYGKSSSASKLSKTNNSNSNTGASLATIVHQNQNRKTIEEKQPLPVCTTYKNCSNPKEHFLPNDTSLDDDYLSECENCKSAHGSRYYLDEEVEEQPQETMTLQRKMDEKEDELTYYRTSSTLPTNTKQKTT